MELLRKFKMLILGVALVFTSQIQAGKPLWTFTPQTATTFFVPNNATVTVQYLITNQSSKTHTLSMTPINGVSQITSTGNCPLIFTLQSKQSCTLTLQMVGNQLTTNIVGGPQVCQQGSSALQCYQPSFINSLNITKNPLLNTYAYITNANSNSLIKCRLDSFNGALIECVDSGAYGLDSPFGISISHTTNSLYIVNQNLNSVSLCNIGSTANVESCIDSGAIGLNSPRGISPSPINSFIYIANENNVVTKCSVNSNNGILENCMNSGATLLNRPRGIAINNAGTLAYIINFSGPTQIVICDINSSTGLMSNCVNSGAILPSFNYGIVLNRNNTIAYISNIGNIISQCNINPTTGFLSACISTSDPGLSAPLFIAINNNSSTLYIPNGDNNTITQCHINLTGVLEYCNTTVANSLLNVPVGIAISNSGPLS